MIKIFEVIRYIDDNKSKKRAFFTGLLCLMFIFSSTDNITQLIFPQELYRALVYVAVSILWFAYWLHLRNSLPKNRKGCIGILICIETENDKQKLRLKNDFVRRLRELINQKKLSKKIQILLCSNYQAECINKVFEEYVKNKESNDAIKRWQNIQKRTNGHFYIYGSIKERVDRENKYFFDIHAIAVHASVEKAAQEEMVRDFSNVWYDKISFQEKIEFRGFEFVADTIFIAVQYIIGIAAFVSGDMKLALELHRSLSQDQFFTNSHNAFPKLVFVKEKLRILLAEEYYQFGRIYASQGDYDKADDFLDKSLVTMNNYGASLLKSVIAFLYRSNPSESLEWVRKAKSFSTIDGTWRYNEGFLLMYMEDFDSALKVYKDIANVSYQGEEQTLTQIYDFNLDILRKHPKKVQSYFIIGFLKYRKESNCPSALEYFNKFLAKSKSDKKYSILRKKAVDYQERIKKKMSLM